jgi:AcrR family transcriptional regulator
LLVSARERLLSAALHRFAADGAVAPTLEEIRTAAGVSVGALYHHFPDKASLHAALYIDVLRSYQEGFALELRAHPDASEGIRAGVRYHLRWVASHRAEATLLLHERPADEDAVRAADADFMREVAGWFRTHAHYGAVRDLPFDLLYALWIGTAQEYCRHWLASGRGRMRPDVARTLSDAAWAALSTPGGG